MKYDVYETYDTNGNIIESVQVPWGKERYQAELSALDAQLTPRRISDAIINDAGKKWMVEFDAKKQLLRAEMAAIDER